MVRIRTQNRPPVRNFLSRREQWRLLLLVMALGLVVIVMGQMRRPEAAARLGQLLAEGDDAMEADGAARRMAPSADEPPAPLAADPVVSTAALQAIRDNAPFRRAEMEAWFALLAVLQRTPSQDLNASTTGEVGYVQLVQQPHVYRAKLVTVRGTVRQVTDERPAENDLGLESYYRLVIQPRGDDMWPIFAYCLTLPDDFPRVGNVAVDVTIVGYFFKNLSYQRQDGLGTAPVLLAKDIAAHGAAAADGNSREGTRPPLTANLWDGSGTDHVDGQTGGKPFYELMALAGWDTDRFAGFADDAAATDDERQQLTELLRRLRMFDAPSLAEWSRSGLTVAALAAEPAEHRGELVRLTGRVRRATLHELPPDESARLEMPAYFECDMELEGGAGMATILAARVPRAWRRLDPLDEPAAVSGVFVKRLPRDESARPVVLLAAKQIDWFPTRASETDVSYGESVLGTLGMDVGLLDDVVNRTAIRAEEREAFYQLLAAVGRAGVSQLIQFASGNIESVRQAWSGELDAPDERRRRLARAVAEQAAEGRYSVAPLFNDADRQIGQLVVLDGVARRVVRVEVGVSPDGGQSDVFRRFGFDHYYEMEVFTGDSQNLPLVFCVRELPPGFPTGGDVRQPVRVAGFFFKSWRYQTRGDGSPGDRTDAATGAERSIIVPLLIGRAPVALRTEQEGGAVAGLVGGGLFVLALVGIWAAAWWYARGDRQFRQTTLADRFSLPPGQSLDNLKLPSVDPPMNGLGESAAGTGDPS